MKCFSSNDDDQYIKPIFDTIKVSTSTMTSAALVPRFGTPEYNRSKYASYGLRRSQLLRDIQFERRNVKRFIEKSRDQWKSETSQKVNIILKHRVVGLRAINLISDFLFPVVPLSCTIDHINLYTVLKKKVVGLRAVNLIKEFLFPAVSNTKQHLELGLGIGTENGFGTHYQTSSIPCSVYQIFQGWQVDGQPEVWTGQRDLKILEWSLCVGKQNRLADMSASERNDSIRNSTVHDLKALCRARYLKVSGKKSQLVERLMGEKW